MGGCGGGGHVGKTKVIQPFSLHSRTGRGTSFLACPPTGGQHSQEQCDRRYGVQMRGAALPRISRARPRFWRPACGGGSAAPHLVKARICICSVRIRITQACTHVPARTHARARARVHVRVHMRVHMRVCVRACVVAQAKGGVSGQGDPRRHTHQPTRRTAAAQFWKMQPRLLYMLLTTQTDFENEVRHPHQRQRRQPQPQPQPRPRPRQQPK